MAKRKRQAVTATDLPTEAKPNKRTKDTTTQAQLPDEATPTVPETIQIVAGSYDQVLHGMTATIGSEKQQAEFADTFLFNAHTSAIRCVAVSPPSAPTPGQTQKVLLASGSTDERINIYSLSAHPPTRRGQDLLAKVAPRAILENPKNREVGSLLHHASTVTALRFPSRSKLLSASDDSTVAVARTRDWAVLSTIRAPVPVPQGRPSGDTAPLGGTPSGVNDLAVHPSMKLMITVSKGERCMRLWNLVTGKKAGVLNLARDMLIEIGEGRHSTGEGRRVVWGSADSADEFAVGFERDIVVFGMDSVPKCRVLGPSGPRNKIHQFTYINIDVSDKGKKKRKDEDENDGQNEGLSVLAVSTEDGRIAFYSTRADHLTEPQGTVGPAGKPASLRAARFLGYVGGKEGGVTGRIKDFAALRSEANPGLLYLVAAGSDGNVRVWRVGTKKLADTGKKEKQQQSPLGTLLGTYETRNRITCMTAFLMIPRPEGAEDSEEDLDEDDDDEDEDDED
ncbi:hypothetical protein HIM_07445 [Hirsutella minnesotensis 3608]|uniref:Protein MAK11 n=1 Tax=Hirsutella minnesotensis 3608 TaxID=1043627 RepID=A0A0F7ZTK0_9HYPO|nr:hypothetical protein HIM_07445 [Hirsutella minnesotensis 3608]